MKKSIQAAGVTLRHLIQAGRRRYQLLIKKGRQPEKVVAEEAKKPLMPDEQQAEQESPKQTASEKYRAPSKKKPKPKWSLENFKVTPEEGKSRFHDFAIPLKLMRAIADLDFRYCTPIQEKSLEVVLTGGDLVGKAHTGTGKTAVFLIATFARLLETKRAGKGQVRALVLAPTRELVVQITKDGKKLAKYSNLGITAVYGGADYQKQQDMLTNRRCDVLVATPGRLLDFMGKKIVDLSRCSILVLDEADRMLDMGFIPDVRRIVGRLPDRNRRQTLLFSATVSDDVKRLASQWCNKPVVVEAEPEQVAVESVEQVIYLTTTEEKYTVLYNLITTHPDDRIIVFANMKNEAKRLANRLQRNGIDCVLLSGDVAQNKRMNRLESFRAGRVKILVATDVAGRGIHIDNITFVVNYTLPYEPEDYVHRIGRTGRAGEQGKAVSFACEEGSFYLPEIEEFVGRKFECEVPKEELLIAPPKRVHVEGKGLSTKNPSKSNKRSGRSKSSYRKRNRSRKENPLQKGNRSAKTGTS